MVTGEVVDRPALGMVDYAAVRSALLTRLFAAGREARRDRRSATDVRLPHLDMQCARRPVVAGPPARGPGADLDDAMTGLVLAPQIHAYVPTRDGENGRMAGFQDPEASLRVRQLHGVAIVEAHGRDHRAG